MRAATMAADAELDGVDVCSPVFMRCCDGDDAVGLAGGDLFVGGVDAAVEVVGLALEAVFVGALVLRRGDGCGGGRGRARLRAAAAAAG